MKQTSILSCLLILSLLLCMLSSSAQKVKEVEIKQAKEFRKSKDSEAMRLIGDVIFKQEDVLMYCDSAYLYNDNRLDAFGNVHIEEGDSLDLFGDTLYYDGTTKLARVRGNIKLIEDDMVLTTNYLDYNLDSDVAYYLGGGKIVSNEEKNTLTSTYGYYYPKQKVFQFKDSVVLINPDYTINSDTLKYNTVTEVTYFMGPTTIKSKEDLIYCENGWYDTKNNLSEFKKNAYIITKEQELRGDSLHYDRETGIGQVFGNVAIIDTVQDLIVYGDYALHKEKDSISIVTGEKLTYVQLFDEDSLFLNADTLYAAYDSTGKHRMIYAYHSVKFFKSDMQGKCDSLVFSRSDSTIQMYHDPVIWSEENQITADSIIMKTAKGKIKWMKMNHNAFIISIEDSNMYNQIKGKDMKGYFRKNHLRKVDVMGNGQTIYYALEDDGTVIGMNKALCSDLVIKIDTNNKVKHITFLNEPNATLFPLDEIDSRDSFLSGFIWRSKERPRKKEDIYSENEIGLIEEDNKAELEGDDN